MKKHFNKNLIKSEEKKNLNRVIPVEKLLVDDDERVRDHCHVTGKFRRTAHWSCDINL